MSKIKEDLLRLVARWKRKAIDLDRQQGMSFPKAVYTECADELFQIIGSITDPVLPSSGVKEGSIRMPAGKYKGKSIEEILSEYLKWVAENWESKTDQDEEIIEAADTEYEFRETHKTHFWE